MTRRCSLSGVKHDRGSWLPGDLPPFGVDNGPPAFLLDGPDGNSWCMKSASLIVDYQTYESAPESGAAKLTQGELGNTYDRVGGPYSDYTP